jgi:hypothetical protein
VTQWLVLVPGLAEYLIDLRGDIADSGVGVGCGGEEKGGVGQCGLAGGFGRRGDGPWVGWWVSV